MKMLCFFLLSFLSLNGYCQSGELIKQIAALKVYGNYINKGYGIARDGLGLIDELKNGELSLHRLFYQRMDRISPLVSGHSKVLQIISLQHKILERETEVTGLLSDDLFYGDEKDYLRRVFDRVLQDCQTRLSELLLLVSDSSFAMEDAQRIRRIEQLYLDMEDNYIFCRNFLKSLTTVVRVRAADYRDTQAVRRLYNLTVTP